MADPAVYQAVEAYLRANWTACPLAFENGDFQPPDSEVANAAWVAVEVTGNLYAQASIGAGTQAANRWREEGRVYFYVAVKRGTGTVLARTYLKQLIDLFRGLQLLNDAVWFRDARIGEGAPGTDDGVWWTLTGSIEFVADV